MFLSRFMPCEECGGSIDGATDSAHQCDPDRVTDYRMFELREQVADFEPQLRRFLTSPAGRFERWLAARDVAGPDAAGPDAVP